MKKKKIFLLLIFSSIIIYSGTIEIAEEEYVFKDDNGNALKTVLDVETKKTEIEKLKDDVDKKILKELKLKTKDEIKSKKLSSKFKKIKQKYICYPHL